jgi:hypothetical protein
MSPMGLGVILGNANADVIQRSPSKIVFQDASLVDARYNHLYKIMHKKIINNDVGIIRRLNAVGSSLRTKGRLKPSIPII